MAAERKYAALPDLDSAPDVYETPDLVDDTTSASNAGAPASPASSYKDLDGEPDEFERIDRRVLRPHQARTHFASSRVDARTADFSDRLGDPSLKGYRVSSKRRRRKGGLEEFEAGFDSDDEETLDQRIARLQREVEEVRLESEKKDAESSAIPDDHSTVAVMQQLSNVLQGLDITRRQKAKAVDDSEEVFLDEPSASRPSPPASSIPTTSADLRQALTKATGLESRLSSIESSLGLATTKEPSDRPQKSMLAAISMLETQLSIISATTAPSLDALSRQINALAAESDKVLAARKAARLEEAASTRPRSAVDPPAKPADLDELSTKIKELHKALPLLERVSPVLPAVIERLRSLRALHEQATVAGQSLDALEKRQAQVGTEIEMWRVGLEKVDETVKKHGEKTHANKTAMELWVRDLEARAQKLGS